MVGDLGQLVSDKCVADQEPRVTDRAPLFTPAVGLSDPRLAANALQTLVNRDQQLVRLGCPLAMVQSCFPRLSYEPSWIGQILGNRYLVSVCILPWRRVGFPTLQRTCMLAWSV